EKNAAATNPTLSPLKRMDVPLLHFARGTRNASEAVFIVFVFKSQRRVASVAVPPGDSGAATSDCDPSICRIEQSDVFPDQRSRRGNLRYARNRVDHDGGLRRSRSGFRRDGPIRISHLQPDAKWSVGITDDRSWSASHYLRTHLCGSRRRGEYRRGDGQPEF